MNAYILTKSKPNGKSKSQEVLKTFIDLMDACSIDSDFGTFEPSTSQAKNIDFLFIDASDLGTTELFKLAIVRADLPVNKVLFNVAKRDEKIQIAALKAGFGGVFLTSEPIELIVKGLEKLKSGHRWFSREIMTKLIDQLVSQYPHSNKTTKPATDHWLTKRELAITERIAEGAQNREIAADLNISVNTVKTHVYSIFRKTNCRNRVELIRWYQARFIEKDFID
ncbi:MAG: response regulator transcription factor [Pseudomonadota bacterium]